MNNIIFNKDECDYIKSFYNEGFSENGGDPLVVHIGDNKTLSIKRKASAKYLDLADSTLIDFILEKLKKINIKSITSESVKIVKYSKGDYFEKHTDFNKYGKGATYKTLVIQLSNSSDYMGGDLVVDEIPQNRDLGSYSLFLSSIEHEVTKVLSGQRFSLTIFLKQEDFYHESKII